MKTLIALISALAITSQASASVLTEDFSDVPGWESNWFGSQSNAANYYAVHGLSSAYRGNNLDGLWLDDNDGNNGSDTNLTILFNNPFALTLTSFSVDLASYLTSMNIVFFDAMGNNLDSQNVVPTYGAANTNPGIYNNYSVTSTTGIGGFSLISSDGIEGNVSLDNLVAGVAEVNTPTVTAPEPGTLILLALGTLGLVAQRRRLI